MDGSGAAGGGKYIQNTETSDVNMDQNMKDQYQVPSMNFTAQQLINIHCEYCPMNSKHYVFEMKIPNTQMKMPITHSHTAAHTVPVCHTTHSSNRRTTSGISGNPSPEARTAIDSNAQRTP